MSSECGYFTPAQNQYGENASWSCRRKKGHYGEHDKFAEEDFTRTCQRCGQSMSTNIEGQCLMVISHPFRRTSWTCRMPEGHRGDHHPHPHADLDADICGWCGQVKEKRS